MKQRIIIGSNVASGVIILGQFGVWDSLVMFVLVGQIPGTSYSLPASAMFGLFSLTFAAIFVSIALRSGKLTQLTAVLSKRRLSKSRS